MPAATRDDEGSERSGSHASADSAPSVFQRLLGAVTRLKKHPILVLLGLAFSAIILLGQVSESIPAIGNFFSGFRSLLPEQVPKQQLAYVDTSGILLKAPKGEPRLLAPIPRDESVIELRWSDDGNQLAALIAAQEPGEDWPSLEDRRIWYIDLARNEQGSWPCPNCGPITFTASQVLTISDGNKLRLNVFSLDALPASLEFSGDDWGTEHRRETTAATLGGGPDGLLFAIADPAGTSAQGGPQLIFRSDAAGHTVYLGKTESHVGVESGVTRANGREIAVVYTEHTSACDNVDRVEVINLTNNSRRELPNSSTPDAWRVSSVDWSPEGDLYSVRYLLSRADETCGKTLINPHITRWDGKAWRPVEGTEGSIVVIPGRNQALAALRETTVDGPLQLHVLYPGETTWNLVADNASQAAWRPN